MAKVLRYFGAESGFPRDEHVWKQEQWNAHKANARIAAKEVILMHGMTVAYLRDTGILFGLVGAAEVEKVEPAMGK